MRCSRCGQEQRDYPSFCRCCGQHLDLVETPSVSTGGKGCQIGKRLLLGLIVSVGFVLFAGAGISALFGAEVGQSPPVSAALPADLQMYGVGELHGVIVGVSDYLYINDVPGPDDGARQIAQALMTMWGDRAHLTLLVNEDATRANIETAMLELAQEEDADDTVIFYFTGHSGEEGQSLLPYDALMDSYTRDISPAMLDRWLDILESTRIVIVIDSCQAGAYVKRLSQPGRIVLASCAPDEFATTELSSYLVAGLSDPGQIDNNVDGQISAEELYSYLVSQSIRDQHPCVLDGYPGELVLAVYQAG